MLSSFNSAIFILLLIYQSINGYNTDSAIWPDGRYALLEPRAGCPTGFQQGWVKQSTRSNNNKSSVLHVQGNIKQKSILTYICTRYTDQTSAYWPTGKYCIYGGQTEFDGRITMHKEDNPHDYHNVLISIIFKWNIWKTNIFAIEFRFSCQTRGNKKIPISLPITQPFYLLPYGSRDCQQVQWMVATSEWIKYHTDNHERYEYNQVYGTVPYHELGRDKRHTGIKMFYCYYESCNSTLHNTSGVFQSPGYPGQYPDGQLCSWRITVPDGYTLRVHFTHYSLYEYDKDCLQLYENDNGIFKPRQTFFGYQGPFNITTNNEVLFVFRSDEENNSTGFRAEYTIFRTPEKTTTAAPSTTTPPFTTTQTTTKLVTTKPPTSKQLITTTERPITTEATTLPTTTTTNVNLTANETLKCNPTNNKNKSYNKQTIHLVKKTFCEETWRIVVMVIPLAVLILIALVIIDIICRCRSKTLKSGPKGSGADDGMIVNPTYGRGSIVLDQPSGTVTDASMLNTVVDQSQSHDDLDDYEDVDYTQLNEIPPPRRSSKRQECQALEPIGADTSAAFYDVLEPPNTEPGLPQSHAAKPFGNGAPEVFYHTLEPPTGSTAPAYQNPSDGNLYTLNPLYEPAENSAPLEANNLLYDSYI